jgi:hypothetical protein
MASRAKGRTKTRLTDGPEPTLYVDTNVLSSMFYRGANIAAQRRQVLTTEWWDTERHHFRVFSSAVTESELSEGVYYGQAKAVRLVRRLPYLPVNSEVRAAVHQLHEEAVVPESKRGDATQLALSTIHRVDYLLTWNHAHLVNADVVRRLDRLCRRNGWRAPLLVTPETIPWVALGQGVRRPGDEEQRETGR